MAIVQEQYSIDGREFIKTYSDLGMKIERQDGVIYDEAVDPVGTGRTYTETDIPIYPNITASDVLTILLGGEES